MNSKLALFDHGEPEEFMLFKLNYKMMLDASVDLPVGTKIQH